jgi:hypothetical protein
MELNLKKIKTLNVLGSNLVIVTDWWASVHVTCHSGNDVAWTMVAGGAVVLVAGDSAPARQNN